MITLIVGGKFIIGYFSLAGALSDETVKQHTGFSRSDAFSLSISSNLISAGIIFVSTGCGDLFSDNTRTHVAKPSVLYLFDSPC